MDGQTDSNVESKTDGQTKEITDKIYGLYQIEWVECRSVDTSRWMD